MKNSPLFITGTDTDAGKTLVSLSLLSHFKAQGLSTLGCKPISAGCQQTEQGLRNEDAVLLQQSSTYQAPYEVINPYAFLEPIAPMIAAEYVKTSMTLTALSDLMQPALSIAVDITLIEGIGGWLQPLNVSETLADYASLIQANVILVVGMRLGCINHSLLTVQSIMRQHGVSLVGWIANCLDPNMQACQDNIALLKEAIPAPCLGVIGYQTTIDTQAIGQQFDQSLMAQI